LEPPCHSTLPTLEDLKCSAVGGNGRHSCHRIGSGGILLCVRIKRKRYFKHYLARGIGADIRPTIEQAAFCLL